MTRILSVSWQCCNPLKGGYSKSSFSAFINAVSEADKRFKKYWKIEEILR